MKKILEKIINKNQYNLTNPYSGKAIMCKKINLLLNNFFPENEKKEIIKSKIKKNKKDNSINNRYLGYKKKKD